MTGAMSEKVHVGEAPVPANDIRRLSRPFWATVLIGAISLLVYAAVLTQYLDNHSIADTEQIFSSMLDDRSEHLAEITTEYGYWDIAVEKMVNQLDLEWVKENFGDYVRNELNIAGVHVLDGSGQPRLHMITGKYQQSADLEALYGDALNELVQTARDTPKNIPPVPATGLLGNLSELFIASAVLMTTYDENGDKNTNCVLIFTKSLDAAALEAISAKYKLPNLRLSSSPPVFWEGGYPIRTFDDTLIGYFVWEPQLAGTTILPLAVLGLVVIYGAMLLSARLFFRRAGETVRALEIARRDAVMATELLADQARRDPLTGLGNRRFLDDTLAGLGGEHDESAVHALLYIDLDYFKDINDSYGHETGDLVLQNVALGLRKMTGGEEQVARLGGDEFVVVLADSGRDRALALARTIIERFTEPMNVNGADCFFGASVGIAFSRNPDELLRQADMALYSAKRRGRGQVAVFSASVAELSALPIETAAQ
ncbi:diguanylate cyclase [Rhodobacterales bacterium]|nr:diguanylate cyclase [Rhodobacterales bacterium]